MKVNISDKNTKKEIFDAYNKILEELEGKPVGKETVEQLTSVGHQFEDSLTGSAEELYQNLQKTISQIKTRFDSTGSFLSQIRDLAERQKKILDEEQKETEKLRKREEEEYQYDFDKRKKRQEEELQSKKDEIVAQEKELKDLRELVSSFDSRLEKEIKDVATKTEKELTTKFDQEKALSSQQAKSAQDLLNQKITSLQETINSYKEEVNRLNATLAQTQNQLSNIAERAVTKTTNSSNQAE